MSKHFKTRGIENKNNPMVIKVFNNNVDRAISALRFKVEKENILKDLKKNRYYESKGQKRRRKKQEAIRRILKDKRKAEKLATRW